ncbi:hypothetical protein PHYBOEH_001966 [Phytophthora boehmeriae]|uniref:PHD-type domain-containing protein n=1 Tax=Phytophthora boehmeriae TaxID=109152 RepID=A0A8T1WXW0_9STRA|nr:hypothetical protein PHYBOEH_001966 [Phytophthora boehmeriae]
MNLFWRSLDTAFFVRKFNKRKFAQLQKEVEDICGVRLSSSHPEYSQVRELLVMPRRERVPAYLVEFRKTRKQKQTFLSSDIFMGVTSETNNAEVEVDEQNALAVGTTVTVAKRTWPGMNKLGGAGRIQKVNEEILPEGTVRFTYNVRYVLGGSEKNVERKYISVVDLDSEDTEKIEESSTVGAGGRAKTGPNVEAIDDTEQDTLSVRLLYEVERTTEEEKLLALSKSALERPPKRRRFQLQFTTENATVFCERILNPRAVDLQQLGSSTPTKELLLHRHFDVKVPDGEAMINECFSSKLLTIEDRAGDEVDEDDSESEDGEDEIKTELTTLQEQFRAVMASNEKMFDALTKKVEGEHFSKSYRHRELQDIRWRNYERMYLELQTAKRQFDDSDNEDEHLNENGRVPSSAGANAVSEGDNESENEDDSCGGLFVNKIKQEGNEVCGLCELSGGDFAATDSGSVVHPQCAMFTPETFFKDGIVHGIDKVAPERRRLVCNICGGRKGLSKIQCANRKCTLAYHVACAYVNGRLTRDPYYQAWCPRHLKSSGMAHFVEIPEHLNKQRGMNDNTGTHEQSNSPARRGRKPNKERKSNQKKKHHDTTPAEATTSVPGGISSSKTSRKRKRKNSGGSGSNMKSSHGGSPGRAIVIGDQEPSCARRLDIDELDDDSDHEGKAVEQWQQGRDVRRVFNKNDVVEVLARDWRGINKPGGVGRVRVVNVESNETGGKDVFYDVNYVVSGGKEKHVAARFVRSYDQSSAA